MIPVEQVEISPIDSAERLDSFATGHVTNSPHAKQQRQPDKERAPKPIPVPGNISELMPSDPRPGAFDAWRLIPQPAAGEPGLPNDLAPKPCSNQLSSGSGRDR